MRKGFGKANAHHPTKGSKRGDKTSGRRTHPSQPSQPTSKQASQPASKGARGQASKLDSQLASKQACHAGKPEQATTLHAGKQARNAASKQLRKQARK